MQDKKLLKQLQFYREHELTYKEIYEPLKLVLNKKNEKFVIKKIINSFIKQGKKHKQELLYYKLLEILKKKYNVRLKQASINIILEYKPTVYVKTFRMNKNKRRPRYRTFPFFVQEKYRVNKLFCIIHNIKKKNKFNFNETYINIFKDYIKGKKLKKSNLLYKELLYLNEFFQTRKMYYVMREKIFKNKIL